MTRRRVRRRVGDIVAIPLGEGRMAFGLVLEEPLMAFFDYSLKEGAVPIADEIIGAPVAFKIWVMNHPITEGLWPVIGHASVPAKLREQPWFFKHDVIAGRLTITKTGAEEVTPKAGEIEGLERAAVWEPEHVTDRLRDHFAGRPNKWVESMKLKG
jgi:hypothetical protein